jgi:hypothetical protein
MKTADLPAKYWNYFVTLAGAKKEAKRGIVNDASFADMKRDLLDPWKAGTRFAVAGTVVSDKKAVAEIRIVHTEYPAKVYADEHFAGMNAAGITDLATDSRFLPFGRGTDYTNQLLFASETGSAPEPSVGLLLQLCERLPYAARVLAGRRKGKDPFEVSDEYDVQDLLHAIIRAYLKYAIDEEPLGKVGGARSSRADLALPDLKTLVEVKYVRRPDDQQRIVEELAQDLILYSAWAPLESFVYLVYNSGDLRDPEALRRLEGETMIGGKRYRTYVILA